MKDQKLSLMDKFYYLFLSFFGTGYAPKAPGTVGSFATIPLIYALGYYRISLPLLLIFILVIFIAACVIAQKIQVRDKVHDPGWIVIDEVIGMLVTWIFVFPSIEIIDLFLVFVVFRVFDIIKIWPASYFDKRMEHGFATIFDDVISAGYAGIVLLLLNYFHLIN